MKKILQKSFMVLLCFMIFTTLTTPIRATEKAYEVQYNITGEDNQGFTAQFTLVNNTKKDIDIWNLEFDYNEKIEGTGIFDIIRKENDNEQYRYHYLIQPKDDTMILANGTVVISYYVDAKLNINDNPQNYNFQYTLKPETNHLHVNSDRSGNSIRLTWQFDENSSYTIEKGTSPNDLKKLDNAFVYKGTFIDTDLDISETLYFRVTALKDHKVISQSEIITLQGYTDSDGDGYDDYTEFKNGTTPLQWDVSSRDLAMISDLAYRDLKAGTEVSTLTRYDDEFKEHGSFGEMKGWQVIKSVPNSNLGFSALAIMKEDKIIVAYRGSELNNGDDLIDDWLNTNVLTYFESYNQQSMESMQFISSIISKYPSKKFYICGHSLGGNLAYIGGTFGMKTYKGRIKKIEVFNAFGLTDSQYTSNMSNDEINAMLNKNSAIIKNHRVEGDIVSKLPSTNQYGETIETEYCYEDLYHKYGLKDPEAAHRLHSIIKHLPRRGAL